MGHASQIALGVALAKPERDVWCLDGDGAALMHLGGMATIATLAPQNYHHVILNNAAHESVGGQPTVAFEVDLCEVARACGYAHVARAEDDASLRRELGTLALARGPALLEVRIKVGSRADLGRPTMSPAELKTAFMQHVRG
jgi:phosphonopyruvate decarboxylase